MNISSWTHGLIHPLLPQASVSWTHNSTADVITSDDVTGISVDYTAPLTTNTLTLSNVRVEQQGEYQCEAEWNAATSSVVDSVQINMNCE